MRRAYEMRVGTPLILAADAVRLILRIVSSDTIEDINAIQAQ